MRLSKGQEVGKEGFKFGALRQATQKQAGHLRAVKVRKQVTLLHSNVMNDLDLAHGTLQLDLRVTAPSLSVTNE